MTTAVFHVPEALSIMRNRSSRSFTVETKSGGRHHRTIIPHRATAPVPPRPAVSWPPPSEPQAPAAEPRRILPNLIAPGPEQVEPEPTQASEEHSPRPRRGRPPKARPAAAEMVEEPIAELAVEIAIAIPTQAPRTKDAPLPRATKTTAALPLGERWKRRLGRWAR